MVLTHMLAIICTCRAAYRMLCSLFHVTQLCRGHAVVHRRVSIEWFMEIGHMPQHLYAATADWVYGEVLICRDIYRLRS